jgi:hypothetical protein
MNQPGPLLPALQVSQAFGSVTNLGGVALHQGLLDYTAQVGGEHHRSCMLHVSQEHMCCHNSIQALLRHLVANSWRLPAVHSASANSGDSALSIVASADT